MRSPFLALLSGSLALGHAIPGKLQARDIGSDELSKFSYWVQYAAASYCYNDYTAKTGASVSCPDNLCSQVEATGATIVYDFSNTTSTDTAGYIALDKTNKAIVLAFRGSYSVRNWIADVEFPYTNPDLCDGCEAELGFWSSWTAVRDPISKTLNETIAANPDYELIVTGHSLGAGVATLAAADLRTKGHPSATLYAYASPRVANSALAKFITAQENNYRFTHINDPVPKLPLLAMGYVHVSPEYYITAPNNATVSASEVKVLQGEVNWDGNTGTGVPSISSFAAHHWYFEEADGCLGPDLCDGCEAELGFWSSWTAVRDPISKTLNETIAANPDYELIVTGHSLGAGVATLAAADLRTKGHPSATLYAYASPRVANSALAKFITAQENNYRFTHINDPVPKLPLLAIGYVHVSPEYYITAPNNATVSASEVKVLQGEVNWDGNTGTGVPSISSFAAHHWYFEEADGCLGPGLPWKV